MAYKIIYDSGEKKYEVYSQNPSRFPLMLAASLIGFSVLTFLFWPEGAQELKNILIPGNDAVTLQALESMKHNLQDGAKLTEAISSFCREIIHGA